jgi:chemotaxis protein histidine kinase CheA
MSDRRAVSAGHLAASSVAANEPWRVAVGGNRVQNMTVEQIARAFAAGQLTLRTPLWPPGTSGWQALGNFEQFQSGMYAQPQAYQQLSSFEEADDDPTRMWTGSADLSELPGMESMEPLPPIPSSPPPGQRPSARTGPRQVSTRAPAALPAAAPVARLVSAAPAPIAAVSPSMRAMRPQRSNGLWLVAGLVGLVGLGSAVLAARGSWSVAAPTESTVAAVTPEPARIPAPSTPAPSAAEPAAPEAPKAAEAPSAAAQPEPSATVEATAAPSGSEVNQASLAKYEDTQASAFVAEAQPAQKKRKGASSAVRTEAKSKTAAAEPAERKREDETASTAKTAAKEPAKEASKVSAPTATRAPAAAAPAPKTTAAKAHPATEVKEAKEAKVEASPVSAAVNDAAATALGNAAKLASSCRPRGGPAGAGKARVIYSNEGEVESVEILTAKFRDTLTASCVRMVFRRAKIPAFKGEPPTFIKSFTIPEE